MSVPSDPNQVLEALRSIHFDPAVSEEYLQQLSRVSELTVIAADTVVFREGDIPTHLYLIVEGAVALDLPIPGCQCKRILTVGESELLGWSPVLDRQRMTATAHTLTETRAVKVDAQQVLAACEHDSRFGYEFMRRTALALAKRLHATRLQLLDVYSDILPDSPHQTSPSFARDADTQDQGS